MQALDTPRLEQIAAGAPGFLATRPYPWANMQGVIREEAFQRLAAEPPAFELFTPEFGQQRGHGQQSHDRYVLQYRPRLDPDLPPAWRDFLAELHGESYLRFLRGMLGLSRTERVVLTMHWHFAPAGASVSPHTDVGRKLGSHIFYFNTEADWDAAWGGQTLVLDDGGRLRSDTAPAFGDLPEAAASTILGNRSFIMKRTEHSWHAVNPISCPPGKLRKVFIVVANRVDLRVAWRRLRGQDADGYRL